MEDLGPQEERRRERRAYGLQEWQCRTREVEQRIWEWARKSIPEHVGELPQSREKRQRFVEFLIDRISQGSSGGTNFDFCVFLSDHRTRLLLFTSDGRVELH